MLPEEDFTVNGRRTQGEERVQQRSKSVRAQLWSPGGMNTGAPASGLEF